MPETSTSPGPGLRGDPRADVHGDAGELVADDLALAGVDACADLEPELRARRRPIARAQRIARAGPSKLARNPSPAVSISRPR